MHARVRQTHPIERSIGHGEESCGDAYEPQDRDQAPGAQALGTAHVVGNRGVGSTCDIDAGFGDMSKMPTMMTPEQAIELYKANAALALEVINTAIEGTARLRKKQFEGEEEAREFQKKHARSAAEARDAQASWRRDRARRRKRWRSRCTTGARCST